MLNKELLRGYYFALEEIKKLFPAMADKKWDRHEETIDAWYNTLNEYGCNDWELSQIIGRVIYHLFSCDCTIIPTADKRYNDSLKTIDIVPDEFKETLANSIAQEVKADTYDWFTKYAGERYLDTIAHLLNHLDSVRRGNPPTFCPFKDKKRVAS